MPRRKSKWQQDEEDVMEGSGDFPSHGDEYTPDEDDLPEDDQDDDDQQRKPEQKAPTAVEKIQQQMLDMEKRHSEELASLRRQIPPAQPKTPPPGQLPPETDWNTKLFQNPAEAVKQIKEETRREIQQEMTQHYQQDQGQRQFWSEFYDAHPDLKGDKDLVETTLKGALADLSNIPVKDAMGKLAELTRERILRYRNKPQKRAVAEGANAPTTPRKPVEEKVPTLGDVIKQRRAERRRASAA